MKESTLATPSSNILTKFSSDLGNGHAPMTMSKSTINITCTSNIPNTSSSNSTTKKYNGGREKRVINWNEAVHNPDEQMNNKNNKDKLLSRPVTIKKPNNPKFKSTLNSKGLNWELPSLAKSTQKGISIIYNYQFDQI